MADKKGLFITFEGGEGCGKTTQSRLLDTYLREKEYNTLLLREPGGSIISEKIREILLHKEHTALSAMAELFLYEAARAQLITEKIKPALEKGYIILCDRYIDSTVAYQGYGRGIDLGRIEELNRIAGQGLLPHLTFLLDINPVAGLERASKVNHTRFEAEELSFHQRVREGFLNLKEKNPERFRLIDATLPIEGIQAAILREIEPLLQ